MENQNPDLFGDSTDGHRERLRQRFLAGEESALTDEALLELLLSYAIVRRDVHPLAKSLLTQFGSLEAVLAAQPAALGAACGLKSTGVTLLKLAEYIRRLPASTAIEKTSAVNTPSPTVPTTTEIRAVPVTKDISSVPSVLQDAGPPRVVGERKLQVSNGYNLDPAQLARLLTFIGSKPDSRKISSAALIEGSGLSARQVENLVSIGSAMGLITPRTQLFTPLGQLVAHHDIFLDSLTTLEFCHFLAAGNIRHLAWYEIFNDMLPTQPPMTQPEWCAWLRKKLAGQYSERSLVKHLAHEVRFLLDAYLVRNFKKLNLFTEGTERTYAIQRYTALQPLSLAAIIYAIGARNGASVLPFAELHSQPGSPGRVFALDAGALRPMVETLHQREWLRFEVRHGLDQIRLIEGFEPLEFIAAAYENRAPHLRLMPQQPLPSPTLL
jgi:hypothetical protein